VGLALSESIFGFWIMAVGQMAGSYQSALWPSCYKQTFVVKAKHLQIVVIREFMAFKGSGSRVEIRLRRGERRRG